MSVASASTRRWTIYKTSALPIFSVTQVMTALANGNLNVGANYINVGSQSYNVRGIGLYKTLDDIQDVSSADLLGNPGHDGARQRKSQRRSQLHQCRLAKLQCPWHRPLQDAGRYPRRQLCRSSR